MRRSGWSRAILVIMPIASHRFSTRGPTPHDSISLGQDGQWRNSVRNSVARPIMRVRNGVCVTGPRLRRARGIPRSAQTSSSHLLQPRGWALGLKTGGTIALGVCCRASRVPKKAASARSCPLNALLGPWNPTSGPPRRGRRTLRSTEDHPAGRSLQHAGHGQTDFFVDTIARAFGHDHRAVFKITNTLADFLAGLDDLDHDRLAWQDNRLERVSQVVDVDHVHAAELCDL